MQFIILVIFINIMGVKSSHTKQFLTMLLVYKTETTPAGSVLITLRHLLCVIYSGRSGSK